MWCAGEIACAHANSVPMLQVVCDGWKPPADERLEEIPSTWTMEQRQALAQCGITIDLILEAYRSLLQVRSLDMPRFAEEGEKAEAIREIMAACGLSMSMKMMSAAV